MELNPLLDIAKTAAKKAAVAILEIYESGDFSIEAKADDSPLTLADKASHNAIVAELEQSNLPILSEEGASIPFEERKDWDYFWMIDPLDGTKEFIKRNGEFTVNIALIHEGKSILGVVQVPVKEQLYFAVQGEGAYKEANGKTESIRVNTIDLKQEGLKVVASRSHLNDDTQKFMDSLNAPEIVSMGSSLKLLAVAEGTADLYPRFAPTMEWDTAAAQAVVEAAGGKVTIKDQTEAVNYNKEDLLNPHFLVSSKVV
ncbi:3'(2'),5'-bisphosphate nucleotidase CysQ [Reichenbachiella ulvae]|uniref:3'(2'),5'-bisphosphate nucleotidase CysQ n=1 Tax=Reichenbachiella ulvae TaxID=2980104 RepID=A0ABT3CXQ8_9BACT|nr:3'(2'),5'-bisphosphate nucleotidase CysQ [Reichenbachiella ulvae]MCV9388481.1 3'(2'),5'-bisphosphate nucleotidase CysQ [Reichenbachiella ulvae]